jgi:hypothetical protein
MLRQARSVIAILIGGSRMAELDERPCQITRDVTFLRSLAMAPLAARLASELSGCPS